MEQFFHAVRLDTDKCKGCLNCIKRCPTGAIRVRGGKANIIKERCIDCGECIRVCPHHAKVAKTDDLEELNRFAYNIALPAPALYGQFNNLDDVDYVLSALKKIGFDDVMEVSQAAELVSEATRLVMEDPALPKPVISSACPVVCRIIRIRFAQLIPHLLNLNAPMEEAGRMARQRAVEKTGLPPEQIGVFFLTPCPAKMTDVRHPIGVYRSSVDGAIAINKVYPLLLKEMDRLEQPEPLSKTGIIGVSWAGSGGEAAGVLNDRYLAADGIEHIINVLEEIEDEKLGDVDFIELNACPGGCVGGALTVENPYVAKARIQRLRKYLPVSCNRLPVQTVPPEMHWKKPLTQMNVLRLADTVGEALEKRKEIERLTEILPGLDCGVCGAPMCRHLAEDVVRGAAQLTDCAFVAREEIESHGMSSYIPAPFRMKKEETT